MNTELLYFSTYSQLKDLGYKWFIWCSSISVGTAEVNIAVIDRSPVASCHQGPSLREAYVLNSAMQSYPLMYFIGGLVADVTEMHKYSIRREANMKQLYRDACRPNL